MAAAGNPDGVTLDQRNMNFHQMLTRGHELKYEADGQDRYEHIYFIDWEEPDNNDFLIVNQLTVEGQNTRRPGVVIYANGLPLVVFELKSPWDEHANVAGAFNQLQHYRADIPRLFEFNAFCVLSDGVDTLQGMYSSDYEWSTPWKSIDGHTVEPETTGSMKTLIEGLFPKARLLDYVRNFIVHEVVNEQITKKGAKYHQYFAVRFAVEKALEASRPDGDRRIGVVWHTQGAGKSLSMTFFVGILRRQMAQDVYAGVQAAVKLILRKRRIRGGQRIASGEAD